MKVGAVVLAAGGGRRMGAQKALLPVDGVPLVRRAAQAACASRATSVWVVTGFRADEVADAVSALPVACVENPDWADGMASSLRCGVDALGDDVGGLLVVLADQPHVDAAVLDALLDAADRDNASTAACAYAGTLGPPAFFARSHFPALRALEGDRGARSVLAREGPAVARVEFPLGSVDLDTPEDLARFRG